MHFNRIILSGRSKGILAGLKAKTGLTANILGRFAICLSLKDKSMPNPDEFDEGGQEINSSVLFGEQEQMFLALMLERLHRDKLDPEIYLHKMMRAHINRGVIALGPRLHDLSNFYELVKEEKN